MFKPNLSEIMHVKSFGHKNGFLTFICYIVTTCLKLSVIHFSPMFHFYSPRKQKIFGFLTFSGGIELEHWAKMG